MSNLVFWLTVGFLGQALFTARFLVQWLASERKRDSIVPVAFWWLSLLGGAALLSVCDFPPRSGDHHRPGDGSLRLRAQPDAVVRQKLLRRARACHSAAIAVTHIGSPERNPATIWVRNGALRHGHSRH